MCDVLSGGPGCMTKCDREEEGGSKLAKNSVTYFMDGPFRVGYHIKQIAN